MRSRRDANVTAAKNESQQKKMKACQAQATEKKLESNARQDYVNNCLKAKTSKDKPKTRWRCATRRPKGMTKDDADKAQSECMKADLSTSELPNTVWVTSCPPGRTDKAAPEQSGRRLVFCRSLDRLHQPLV